MKTHSFILLTIIVLLAIGLTNIVSGNNDKKSSIGNIDASAVATVNIKFDGLMAICFGNPARASLGFLNVPHHKPELTIKKIKGTEQTVVAVLNGDELRNTLSFDVEGRAPQVARYQAASMENDTHDFRWTIDMESDLFQKQLYIKEDRLFGKIHFNTGLFYADNLSDEQVRFFSNDGQTLPFNRRVAEPAARIDLNNGEALVISGGKQPIRLIAEAGVHYEITVFNLPPADMASIDHWMFYYDVIGEKVTPFAPVMVKKATYSPKPLLCVPIVLGKSNLK